MGVRLFQRASIAVFVEVFLTGGTLSIWRGIHVDISRTPGEAVSYANSGGATLLCCHGNRGGPSSLQPNKWKQAAKEACCAAVSSENPDGAGEEGKNCSLHFALLQFLHPMMQVAVRKGVG